MLASTVVSDSLSWDDHIDIMRLRHKCTYMPLLKSWSEHTVSLVTNVNFDVMLVVFMENLRVPTKITKNLMKHKEIIRHSYTSSNSSGEDIDTLLWVRLVMVVNVWKPLTYLESSSAEWGTCYHHKVLLKVLWSSPAALLEYKLQSNSDPRSLVVICIVWEASKAEPVTSRAAQLCALRHS